MPEDSDYDCKGLPELARAGNSPFSSDCDVNLFFHLLSRTGHIRASLFNFHLPAAFAAEQALLHPILHIMLASTTEEEEMRYYRLFLEHGNRSIAVDSNSGLPWVTSLYDWKTGCIAPAILSDPLMAATVDLGADEEGSPSITRVDEDTTEEELEEYMNWSGQYFKAHENHLAIRGGKYACHLWFALRDWRGEDPERYFGSLGVWAEKRRG
ncbi:hypothetical protein VTI74DRAFT_6439 [Chaetomium olivicolor]